MRKREAEAGPSMPPVCVWKAPSGRPRPDGGRTPRSSTGWRPPVPYVAVKLALSLDGGIAAAPGERTELSGREARHASHRLRAGFDAVLVGAVTARVDDPRLTVRDGGVEPRTPQVRIVLNSQGAVRGDSALLREGEGPVIVFVRDDLDPPARARLERTGARVEPVPPAARGLDLGAVLAAAAGAGIRSILCEGGGKLASSFLAEGLAGRLYLLHAPLVLGAAAVPAFPGPFPEGSWRGWRPAFAPERLGGDVLTVYEREC